MTWVSESAISTRVAQAPLVVLGPSIGTTARTLWGGVAELLGDSVEVLGWDLPGHGGAPTPRAGSCTMADLAAGVLALVDARSGDTPRPFVYAGDSAGGCVGLQLLLDAPARVRGGVLVCTGARIGDAEFWAERSRLALTHGAPALRAIAQERWFGPGFVDRSPRTAARLLDATEAVDARGYAAVCGALAGFDVRPRLQEIEVPVVAVAGADDKATPPPLVAQIVDGVRDGRSVVLPGVGHLAPAEAPEAVADVIAAMVDRVTRDELDTRRPGNRLRWPIPGTSVEFVPDGA